MATAWLMREGRLFTYIADEWTWLLHRRGHSPGVFLRPHAEHLTALPVLAYKSIWQIFGARSTVPVRLLNALLAGGCATMLFVFAKRRVGPWIALAAASVLLFFGPGWSDLLWAFQMEYLGSLVSGFAALLLLDREDRPGDVGAAVLLTVSIASSSVGVMMLAGAIVELLLQVRSRGWQRLWIPLLPLLLYGLWYSQYGVSSLQLQRIHTIPLYTFDGVSAAVGSIFGLAAPATGPLSVTLDPGTSITVVLAVILCARLVTGRAVSARAWGMLAATLAFWAADTLSYGPGRGADASRYTYPVAMFLIAAAVDLCSGLRVSRRATIVIAVVAAAAVVSNLGFLREGANEFSTDSTFARAELGAMTVARPVVAPTFGPGDPAIAALITDHGMSPVQAGAYFSATDKFGSPAESVPAIVRQPETVREAADLVLVKAERLAPSPVSRGLRACTSERPAQGQVETAVGPSALVIKAGDTAISAVAVRRLAQNYMYGSLGPIPSRSSAVIRFPMDGSQLPWHIRLSTTGPVRICPTR